MPTRHTEPLLLYAPPIPIVNKLALRGNMGYALNRISSAKFNLFVGQLHTLGPSPAILLSIYRSTCGFPPRNSSDGPATFPPGIICTTPPLSHGWRGQSFMRSISGSLVSLIFQTGACRKSTSVHRSWTTFWSHYDGSSRNSFRCFHSGVSPTGLYCKSSIGWLQNIMNVTSQVPPFLQVSLW